MRKSLFLCFSLWLLLAAGCVTVNVYFPEAAAQQAADRFIDSVIDAQDAAPAKPASSTSPRRDPPAPTARPPAAMLLELLVPSAQAAQTPDLTLETPATRAIHARMRERFAHDLAPLLDGGVVGLTRDGLVALRDADGLDPAARARAEAVIAAENRDREALYREIAQANGHPEWEAQIRVTFARSWIEHARPGWYHQDAAGRWQR
ncbi:YdbL family protein [Aerosticca soli]|uniref:DUF1318 domain-containing protein n=1 Tax=Aerosticca soli TaxID=2010829 RepID=A0A2Z6E425_9GAMM|nr:YdbL family protein [Aerosticca soli]BBD79820.1 hypothetical protein ALSL_1158 [Aerosticca soli]